MGPQNICDADCFAVNVRYTPFGLRARVSVGVPYQVKLCEDRGLEHGTSSDVYFTATAAAVVPGIFYGDRCCSCSEHLSNE